MTALGVAQLCLALALVHAARGEERLRVAATALLLGGFSAVAAVSLLLR